MKKKAFFFLLISLILLMQNVQAYPIVVTDCLGNEITIEKTPERIVSLIPSNTEILFAVGAGENVVGVTDYSDYPEEAKNISTVGGYAGFSTEKILDLEPDLVLAETSNGEDTLNNLRDLGLTVVTLESKTVDDILNNIVLVGNITGNEKQALEIVEEMRQSIDVIEEQTESLGDEERPRALYLVSFEPMYVAGANSFPDSLIKIAGGKNIVEAESWPILSIEEIVDKDPEIIICSGMGGYGDVIKEQVLSNSLLSETTAVKNNNVLVVSDSNTIERPGPRIVQGLAELHNFFEEAENEKVLLQEQNAENSVSLEEEDQDTSEPSEKTTPGFGALLTLAMLISICFIIKGGKNE